MNVLLLEPFFTGSHAAWAQGYARHSRHAVRLSTLRGKYWKWRMEGGALALAHQFLQQPPSVDLILASDMLDLSTFLALTRQKTASLPSVLYFHENQLTYPWSPWDGDPAQGRDLHYAFINYRSALVADALWFNSRYHQEAFFAALPDFLRRFPDQRGLAQLTQLRAKSQVMPLGLDLQALAAHRPASTAPGSSPLILWNHRWEYDKGPEAFFHALFALAEEGQPFRLAVLGQGYRRSPAIFDQARTVLRDRIVHWGYVPDRAAYAAWLWRADLLPVTAQHDFFGASVVEAIHCHTWPLLPQRLAYPEHIPAPQRDAVFYPTEAELLPRLRQLLQQGWPDPQSLHATTAGYDWSRMAPRYDQALAALRPPTVYP